MSEIPTYPDEECGEHIRPAYRATNETEAEAEVTEAQVMRALAMRLHSAALAADWHAVAEIRMTCERDAYFLEREDSQRESNIRMTQALIDDAYAHITALQVRGTALIDDQRALKGLLRQALASLGETGDVGASWVLRTQAMLERMK